MLNIAGIVGTRFTKDRDSHIVFPDGYIVSGKEREGRRGDVSSLSERLELLEMMVDIGPFRQLILCLGKI